jgi:hypothetical protein
MNLNYNNIVNILINLSRIQANGSKLIPPNNIETDKVFNYSALSL